MTITQMVVQLGVLTWSISATSQMENCTLPPTVVISSATSFRVGLVRLRTHTVLAVNINQAILIGLTTATRSAATCTITATTSAMTATTSMATVATSSAKSSSV